MSDVTLDDARPKARKQHKCDNCYRVIETGETYRRWRCVGDDGPYTWKSCSQCDALIEHIWATDPDARYLFEDGLNVAEYLDGIGDAVTLAAYRRQWRPLTEGQDQ